MQLNGHRSGWTEVISGAPQGSVLGPPFLQSLLMTYIYEEVLREISKFADDTKIASQLKI